MLVRQFALVCIVLSIIGGSLANAENMCSVQGESDPDKYFGVPMQPIDDNIYKESVVEDFEADLNNPVTYFRYRKVILDIEAENKNITEECKKKFDHEFYRNLRKAIKEREEEYANKCMAASFNNDTVIGETNDFPIQGVEVVLSPKALADLYSLENQTKSYAKNCTNIKSEIQFTKKLDVMYDVTRAMGLPDEIVGSADAPADATVAAASTVGGNKPANP